MEQIEAAALGSVSFFYQRTDNPNRPDPAVGDIVILKDQGKLDQKKRIARVVGLNKTSLKVQFPNRREGIYPRTDAILVYRPAWGEDTLKVKKAVRRDESLP